MIQARQCSRLAPEARPSSLVFEELFGKDLHGHVPSQPGVLGPPDLSHSPRADRTEDFVGPEAGAGGDRHGFGFLCQPAQR